MDIGSWLRGLGLERYEQAFRENEIDLRVLPELTADDLKELGVAAIGHRRLLLKAIASCGRCRACRGGADGKRALATECQYLPRSRSRPGSVTSSAMGSPGSPSTISPITASA